MSSVEAMSPALRGGCSEVVWLRLNRKASKFPADAYIIRTWRAMIGGPKDENRVSSIQE